MHILFLHTHTQLIGKLGWLENIFITPSHHRVHHASNYKYLNKNYGDIFVFWDKLFGTFQKEEEQPVFGLTHPLRSKSFLWQHFHYYMEILEACRRSGGFIKSVAVLFGKPEELPQSIRPELERKYLFPRTKPGTQPGLRVYLNFQIAMSLLILFIFTLFYSYQDKAEIGLVTGFILITMVSCGAMLEQKKWIHYLEFSRLVILNGFVGYELGSFEYFVLSMGLLFILAYTTPVQHWYYRLVYSN